MEMVLKVVDARKQSGLSQKELAQKAHITQQQLSRIEHGTNCNMLTFLVERQQHLIPLLIRCLLAAKVRTNGWLNDTSEIVREAVEWQFSEWIVFR